MRDDARIAWVDVAKGLCIVMVVAMHATLGVEKAAGSEGYMHAFVDFAKPFRMPDFFLLSGLFLALVVDRPWRTYLDRKVVHFAYFYLLWLAIQTTVKAQSLMAGSVTFAELAGLVEPAGTIWFIYMLPVFFVVTKALRNAPPLLLWLTAAALEIAPIDTGLTLVDQFASRYVYFLTGFYAAPTILGLARRAARHRGVTVVALAAWALVNGAAVEMGVARWPGVGLALGLAGAAAVVALAALIARSPWSAPLRLMGARSIAIFLAFFLPMAIARTVLVRLDLFDIGTVSVLVTAAAIAGPLVLDRLVRGTRFGFLFERPLWARLGPAPSGKLAPAE